MRNVEIKARCADLECAARHASRVSGAAQPRVLVQEDTYFEVGEGRLKLREQPDGAALIFYRRSDSVDPTLSEYDIVDVGSPGDLKRLLGDALGRGPIVRKTRMLYLAGSVRIHLDKVEGLGSFIEFEAVLGADGGPEESGRVEVERLIDEFEIDEADLVAGSYREMVEGEAGSQPRSRGGRPWHDRA